MTAIIPRKNRVEELAVFTGRPTFSEPLHVGRPNVGNRDAFLERTNSIIERRWFTNDGPYVHEFESRIAERTGVEHCVVTSSGTIGLQLVASALGLTGEVVLPSFTFIATAHAFRWQGLTPVFCDIDEKTHNLDPSHVAELITDRTSAIVGVHVWGRPAYSEELTDLAKRHGLRLLFDAAHALGCSHDARPIGGQGEAEVLSFHATKIVNTFEGGAILTSNGELAERLRRMRNFGFIDYDDVREIGLNAKMSEISAAMGLTTLECLDDFVDANRRNYDQYVVELDDVPGLSVIPYDRTEQQNYQYVVIEIDPALCPVPRDALMRILHAENVLARRYFYPGCHRMEPYRSLAPDLHLPITERVASRILIMPTGSGVTQETVTTICQILSLVAGDPEGLPSTPAGFTKFVPPA